MRIWIPGLLGFLSACAMSPHAVRVSCEGKLVPINAPLAAPQVSRADAGARKQLDSAP